MPKVLIDNKKTEICEEPKMGFGVRATADIEKGEIIQECSVVLMPRYTSLGKNLYDALSQTGWLSEKEKYFDNLRQNLHFLSPESHYFKWLPEVPLNGEHNPFTCIVLGAGSLFNSSNSQNNIGWQITHFEGKPIFVFRAERDIKQGEFLRSFFGYFISEDGSIYPCKQNFGLGLDIFDGKVRCKAIRYGTIEEFEQSKINAATQRLLQIFQISKDNGFGISRIEALLFNGETKAFFDFPEGLTLAHMYSRLTEFYNSNFPLIKIIINYEDKEGKMLNEQVIFKK